MSALGIACAGSAQLDAHNLLQPLMADRRSPDGDPQIAVDTVAASIGDVVVITSDGRLLRDILKSEATPARWSTIGLVDTP